MAAGGEDRPCIGIAKQLVGNPLHVDEVLGIGADTAENAEDRLHEQRRLDQAPVEKVCEIVEMADIVAFELKPGATRFAQILKDPLDVGKGVAENKVARHFEMTLLPWVLELFIFFEQREKSEIHRTHV